MALVNAYINLDDFRERAGIPDHGDDPIIEDAVNESCRAIDVHCGQFFYDSGSATARSDSCKILNAYTALVDPFHTLTGLVIKTDDDDDGTYETTWAASDYEMIRFGGAASSMLSAPYDTIRAVGSRYFPTNTRRQNVLQVTARWGWAAFPSNVVSAARIVSLDQWKQKDVAFGVITGTVEFGGIRVSNDVFRRVSSLLQPFMRVDRTAGIA